MEQFQDRRIYPRYHAKENIYVTLSGEKKVKRPLLDISCSGAKIVGQVPDNKSDKNVISFLDDNSELGINREFKTSLVNAAKNHFGVSFEKPLSGAQVAKLAKHSNVSSCIEIAMRDRDNVTMDIRNIQSCRSQIFNGALTIISVWVMGACGLWLTNKLNPSTSLFVGGILPFFVLTIAIFSTIEKARAINNHRGFLIALDEYARHGIAPPNYLGWSTLYSNRSECRARIQTGLCPHPNQCCWNHNLNDLESITAKKHIFPKILDSFTAFSSIVYGILYVFASIVFWWASIECSRNTTLMIPVTIGVGGLSVGLGILLMVLLTGIRRGKQSVEANYLIWKSALEKCRRMDGSE
jgi:hypothetical protein